MRCPSLDHNCARVWIQGRQHRAAVVFESFPLREGKLASKRGSHTPNRELGCRHSAHKTGQRTSLSRRRGRRPGERGKARKGCKGGASEGVAGEHPEQRVDPGLAQQGRTRGLTTNDALGVSKLRKQSRTEFHDPASSAATGRLGYRFRFFLTSFGAMTLSLMRMSRRVGRGSSTLWTCLMNSAIFA